MLLNNIDEIRSWLSLHTDLNRNEYEIVWHENCYVVNTFCDVGVYMYGLDLPIQFGTIEGCFFLNVFNEDNFDIKKDIYWPYHINTSLNALNLPLTQNDFKHWKTSYVGTTINLCGETTAIESLDFLENTNFENILIKLRNTPFKDDIIPTKYNLFFKDTKKYSLTQKDVKDYIIKKEDILNYFDFNIENTKEIK